MMPGGLQVVGRCTGHCGTPALIDPPEGPSTTLVFSGTATFSHQYSPTVFTQNHDYNCGTRIRGRLVSDIGCEAVGLSSTLEIEQPLTGAIQGSYSIGLRWYRYSYTPGASSNVVNADSVAEVLVQYSIPSDEDFDVSGNAMCNPQQYDTYVRPSFYVDPETTPVSFQACSYDWLAVAQRDLPGLRIRRKSGTDTWIFEHSRQVSGLKIYNLTKTKSFQVANVNLLEAANAINASSISSEIEARATYRWTTAGESSTGTLNPLETIFTRENGLKELKDIGPTYVNTTCVDSTAPAGWTISSEVPMYFRGETLPPTGIVRGTGGPFMIPGFINQWSSQYPEVGLFTASADLSVNEEAARNFVLRPTKVVNKDASDLGAFNAGPNTVSLNWSKYMNGAFSINYSPAALTNASRDPDAIRVSSYLDFNYCEEFPPYPPTQTVTIPLGFTRTRQLYYVCNNECFSCTGNTPSAGCLNADGQCMVVLQCTDGFPCCGEQVSCTGNCNIYYYRVTSNPGATITFSCNAGAEGRLDAFWRMK